MTTAKLALKLPPVEAGTMGWWMAGILATAFGWFGGLNVSFQVLVALSMADLVTGGWAAAKDGVFSRGRFFQGFGDTVLMWLICAVAHFVGSLVPIDLSAYGNPSLGALVASWYSLKEGTSLVANLSRAGLPLPRQLEMILAAATRKLDPEPPPMPARPISEWPLLRDHKD